MFCFCVCPTIIIFVLFAQKSDCLAGHVLSKEKIYVFAALYDDKELMYQVIIFVYMPQAWDLGYGFDIGILYKSGWFVFFGSILAAASLAYFL